MSGWKSFAGALLVLLAAAAPAADAESAVRAGRLELYPTFECIGLRLSYTGDANSNATAKLKYREKGSLVWRDALPPVRIRGNRFAGSIFFLTPGRQFEVQVTLDDPDGAALERASGIVATRAFDFPTGGGRHWYVSTGGADDNDGTRVAPLRSIARAAEKAGAGDVVHVLPGVYRESVRVTARGNPGAYVAFRAAGSGVILSGADAHYENPEAAARWHEAGGGIYFAVLTWRPGYVGAEGKRLYH